MAKTNPAQWSVILDFAEENPMILTKRFDAVNSKKKYEELWIQLTTTLNSMGYIQKTKEKWQKAVADWKCKVKSKAADINKGLVKTGGGGPLAPLTENEKRLMAIIGWTAVKGTTIHELGFETTSSQVTNTSLPTDTQTSVKSFYKEAYVPTSIRLSPPPLASISKEPKLLAASASSTLTQEHVPSYEENFQASQSIEKTPSTPKNKIKLTSQQNSQSFKKYTTANMHAMHNETLNVLKEINENLQKMAASQERFCTISEKLVNQNLSNCQK